jgi:hypothetical protein
MFGEAALEEALVILVVEDDQSIQSIVAEALEFNSAQREADSFVCGICGRT